jgi:hypothetical protein
MEHGKVIWLPKGVEKFNLEKRARKSRGPKPQIAAEDL